MITQWQAQAQSDQGPEARALTAVIMQMVISDLTVGTRPARVLADKLYSNGGWSRAEGEPNTPEVSVGEQPDRTETTAIAADDKGPAGTRTSTFGARIYTERQGQEASIQFDESDTTVRGTTTSNRNVTGRVTTGLCPSAAGVVSGSFRIEGETRLKMASPVVDAVLKNTFLGTFEARTGDDGRMISFSTDVDAKRAITNQSGVDDTISINIKEGSDINRSSNSQTQYESWIAANSTIAVATPSGATLTEAENELFEPVFFAWSNVRNSLLQDLMNSAEQMWRYGYCLELRLIGVKQENAIAPNGVAAYKLAVRHKFEHKDLAQPIAGKQVTKWGAFDPLQMSTSPADGSFKAGPDSGEKSTSDYNRLNLESMSKRGGARNRIVMSSEKPKKDEPPITVTTPPVAQKSLGPWQPKSGTVTLTARYGYTDAFKETTSQGTTTTSAWNLSGAHEWRFTLVDVFDQHASGPDKVYLLSGTTTETSTADWSSSRKTVSKCGNGSSNVGETKQVGSVKANRTKSDQYYKMAYDMRLTVKTAGDKTAFTISLPEAFQVVRRGEMKDVVTTQSTGCGVPTNETRARTEIWSFTSQKPGGKTSVDGVVDTHGAARGTVHLPDTYATSTTWAQVQEFDRPSTHLPKPAPVDVTVEIDLK